MDPDDPWQGATLVMRDDYEDQTYDWLQLTEGVWPVDRAVSIERISSNYYGIHVGDEVIFELDGTDRSFPVTGKIRHPFVPPPDFGGNAYFFVDSAAMARFGIPQGQFLQVLARVEPYSEEYARDRAAEMKEQLAKQDVGVAIVIYQKPEEHWARPVLAGITLVLRILAVVSLFTSVIIVINTTTAVITQQTDQIGVIKAIGGTTGTIMQVYLAGVLVYGILALAIALPLGMITAFFGARQLLMLFNIDHTTFVFSQRAVLFQVLAAIAAPLLAALWPVLSGARMSVREAIASYGLGGHFGSSRFDQWIDRLSERFLPSTYAISLSNMFRRKGRLALTQGVLILAGTMFLMVLTLAHSMDTTLENELNRRAYDLRLFFFQPQRTDRARDLAEQVPGVLEAEPWYTVAGTVLREGERVQDTGGLGAELFGIPEDSTMYRPYMVDGRWLEPGETDRVAVVSQETAEFNDLIVGDIITIDLGEQGSGEWEIVGTYQAITPDLFATDPIYAPLSTVVDTTKKVNIANQVLIRSADKSAAGTAALMTSLSDAYKSRQLNVNPFFSRTKGEDRVYAFNQFGIVTGMLFSLALIMGIVGGIGLMGSLAISVVERTREIGVLRSIGAESPTIVTMFVVEGVLQGVLSWLIAVPLSFIIARPVSALLGQTILDVDLDFAYNYPAVFIWLAAILAIAVLASLLPAHAAVRVSVRQSLAYG
jgi:putative ABC transport system permease protein